MGFFKSLFGQSDYQQENEFDINDYDSDDDDVDLDDYCDDDDSDSSDMYYSIAKVRVVGFDKLDDTDKDYIRERLEESTHVYLRYDFDTPNKQQALQVYHHSNLLGYIEPSKSEILHSYLCEAKIGAVIVSKIRSKDFKVSIELKVYYEDFHGKEEIPPYPLSDRSLSIYETEYWEDEDDWSDKWSLILHTDELSYQYSELFDDTIDDDVKIEIDMWFLMWIGDFLAGTCITKQGAEHYVDKLQHECAKDILWKRIKSYMEHKGYAFADKELFTDLETDTEEEELEPAIAKRYDDTYQISYIDGQGKRQDKTIKNTNFFTFVAGVKYRENWEELVAKLTDGMKLRLKTDPENEFDSNAIAVYNKKEHLGYIPKKDIPAVRWCMDGDELDAEIEYVDEDYVSLIIPATFQKLAECNENELKGVMFFKTERTKYEIGAYQEARKALSKQEFLEGVKQQNKNL